MKTSFEKVVGVTEGEEKEILENQERRFVFQDFKELEGKEREKTEEERKIILFANEITDKFLEKYGGKKMNIPISNFHFIKENEWEDKKRDSFCDYRYNLIAIREDNNKLRLLTKIIHEIIHFKVYNALQVVKETSELKEYRAGFTVFSRDGKDIYFGSLNEAITEEITKEIFLENIEESFLKEEFLKMKDIMERYKEAETYEGKPLFNDDVYSVEIEENLSDDEEGLVRMTAIPFSYARERKILNLLVDKLFSRNEYNFKDRKEVFNLFKQGAINGNILPIGKLIDKTFGKGTLRKIGELDKDVRKLEKFVLAL